MATAADQTEKEWPVEADWNMMIETKTPRGAHYGRGPTSSASLL